MSQHSPQRHQHGVRKKLVEGVGGVLVGAALVLLMRGLVKRRNADQTPSTTPATSGDPA
ncbi:MAG: carbon monoxide dehydrogenase [Chromatiales bacterium]|nr:carbon monoxide dehydrogenase [Chromatiales bacterium]